ncbi:XrtN system VIT domain-containing protein [Pedobacter duraquae]|uniref:XrtN system VIT domain protein n=1 Tax=Pedobacter duraquae TaxID=425511 RepID=A0A4R6IKN1_9SPHI|nr:XrtN system VIT domain-containing protein [Pedobacter duraquae]TDO22603.1 XrtN system VIT domain protein [Pedobacter duraquae]
MKQFFNLNLKDPVYKTGIILVAISFLIFALTTNIVSDIGAGIFVINYSIAAVYQIYLIAYWFKAYKWKWSKGDLRHTVLLLVLLFISAFALNREMNVFDASVTWCSVWIILSTIAILLASNLNASASRLWKNSIFFVLGSALVLFIYYAIYLFPLYLISLVGLLAIGISIHSFVPAFLAAAALAVVIRAIREDKKLWYSVSLGFLLPILLATAFSVKWFHTNKEINTLIDHNTLNEPKLPAWIQVSQQLTPDFMTERLLKTGLVYHEVDLDHLFWGPMPGSSFDEQKQHDPLVVIATLLFKRPNLDEQDRIKILKSMYQARHQAQDRLWAGDHLETISVVSNIKLYPAYRMAYTEKTLSIRNNAKSQWSNQEAIYTFHLTEGSVVSSLSLWIDGKEEKSRLSTKAKADSAYRTIVGIERHDPSVIHWQEGNTITVRVFPCTPKENRKFKIGVTSPMLKKGNQLIYQPISFDGPMASNASKITQLTHSGPIKDLRLPSAFTQTSPEVYQSENDQSAVEISCAATPLSTAAFSFAGAGYQLENYNKRYRSFTAQHLYLDINSSWTKAEFDTIWANAQGKAIYVFDDKMIRLNVLNRDALFTKLTRYNFSLFPIQEISSPERSLLISKGGFQSPNLGDLDDSIFGKELVAYLKTPKRLQVFNLGPLESPYLKALKELRVFTVETGTISDLGKTLSKHIFIQNQENEQIVVIEDAGMMIRKTGVIKSQNAPDHLLRLFAYNDIMKKVGPDFFSKNYIRPELIGEAEQAFIVSPVSSLIVLETQKDYDRFDIEANKNSLKNASMKSSGAVPEPHEWVLFILCIGTAAYVLHRKRIINTAL